MANRISVPRQPVESSAFVSVGYHPESQILALEFKSGGVHHLHGVTPEDADAFQTAKSLGAHFHQHLRGKFESVRFDEQDEQQ